MSIPFWVKNRIALHLLLVAHLMELHFHQSTNRQDIFHIYLHVLVLHLFLVVHNHDQDKYILALGQLVVVGLLLVEVQIRLV